MLKQAVDVSVHVQLRPRGRAKRAVRRDRDLVVLAQLDQALLRQIRVDLHLVHLGVVLGVAEDVVEQGTSDVRDTNVLSEAAVDELLHRAPGLAEGDAADGVALAVGAEPARGESVLDGDVLERAREVDEEEIEIVDAPEAELVLGSFQELWKG